MGFRLSTIRSASQKLGGDSVKAPMKFRVWCNELCRRTVHIICTMSADDHGLAVPWLIPPVIGLSPWDSVPICGQSMRELRWTNWHKNRVFSRYFSFALSIAFHERSVLIPSLPTQNSHTEHREASHLRRKLDSRQRPEYSLLRQHIQDGLELHPAPKHTHNLVAIEQAWGYYLSIPEFVCVWKTCL